MYRVLMCAVLALLPQVAIPQGLLPQVESNGELRPLVTMDVARGYEAVGRLDSDRGYCSATLIASDLILTAAHCLFDERGNRIADTRFTFRAGLRNGHAEAERGIRSSVIPEDYRYPGPDPDLDGVAADMALLALDSPIALPRIRPIRTAGDPGLRDLVTIVSYGRDRDDFASIEEDCRVLQRERAVIAMSCRVVEGSSGAPVLRETPSGLEVVAVVSATGMLGDVAASFAVDVEAHLQELLSARIASRSGGAVVRRLTVGDGGRSDIGARFLRP
jgi:V8-like Glu-specific endopeptidase